MSKESEVLETLEWRYATKRFDPKRKLTSDQWRALESALVMAPSSYGLQPWKFLVITDAAIRERLRAHSWNQTQVTDCSHFVVMLARTTIDGAYVQHYVDRIAAVRGVDKASLRGYQEMMLAGIAGRSPEQLFQWSARQVYIALGQLMTIAAQIRVDACPMEGLDPEKYDELLNLKGSGYRTVVACALGFRSSEDTMHSMKKVRFPNSDLIQFL